MGIFAQQFCHGFYHGMFDRMFCGWNSLGWNTFGCWNQMPVFFTPNYMAGGSFRYQTPSISMPSIWNVTVPDFSANFGNWYPLQCYNSLASIDLTQVNPVKHDVVEEGPIPEKIVTPPKTKGNDKHSERVKDADEIEINYDVKALKNKWKHKKPNLTDNFYKKVVQIAKDIYCDPNDLMGLMESESGILPDSQNEGSKATGLIQFMPSTVKSLGTSIAELKNMTAEEQLNYVEKYLKEQKTAAGYANSDPIDAGTLYALTFLPKYAKQEILSTSGDRYYSQNEGLDLDKDGKISKTDLAKRIEKKCA